MITWSDNYLMGIEQFDQEHKQIFKLAGQILERMRTWGSEERVRMFVVREAVVYLNDYFEIQYRYVDKNLSLAKIFHPLPKESLLSLA